MIRYAPVIPRGTVFLSTEDAYRQCKERVGVTEITKECAATIAAFWQGPSYHALTFAELVSHQQVTWEDLRDAILEARMWVAANLVDSPASDDLALYMLATWGMNGTWG